MAGFWNRGSYEEIGRGAPPRLEPKKPGQWQGLAILRGPLGVPKPDGRMGVCALSSEWLKLAVARGGALPFHPPVG